ncbi:hypothetical protein [Streptomyces sp. enrichment culture]|uniref:hypothetical protein n=1 Tax=Streptomyces sp. enrichment culture TaxID=1795815 RepID=UPI003F55869C
MDTTFTAGVAALPRLAGIGTVCAPEQLPWVLLAAGAIAGCAEPGALEGAAASAAIDVLRGLTEECLSRTSDTEEYVYLLQALLAFDGLRDRGRCLDALHSGEYEVDCPYCGVELFVVLDDGEPFCRSEDRTREGAAKSPIRRVEPGGLDVVPRRLYDRALADGRQRVADGLPYLFGRAVCPDCATEFTVGEQAAAHWVA